MICIRDCVEEKFALFSGWTVSTDFAGRVNVQGDHSPCCNHVFWLVEIAAASIFSSSWPITTPPPLSLFYHFFTFSFHTSVHPTDPSLALSLPHIPLHILSHRFNLSWFLRGPLFLSSPALPLSLLFSLCRQTVKVKSNPFLMESNCMKMCRAGTEKEEQSEVKRKRER